MYNKIQNNDNDSKYTFWRLLQEFKVEIPIIQRDYAQGRRSDNASAIREELLGCIYNALKNEEALDFDFVYGTVNNKILYPLDGQQRLTTFYLLHWYIAEKEGKMDIARSVLSKFSYTTRISSREFCEMLVQLDYRPQKDELVSAFIKNKNGYFRTWDTDPTISNMLTMLDAIHEKFFDTENLFDLLVNDELLTFSYRSMEHYALTDDLYIKMNARGKMLSVFENFKAKFIQHLKECKLPYTYFENKIDGKWTDLLWEYRAKDNTIDKQFMNLFCYITEMLYLENEQQKEGDSPFKPTKIRSLIDFYDTEKKVKELYSLMDLWKNKTEASKYMRNIFSNEEENGKVRIFEGKSDIFSAVVNGENVTLANKLILFAVMKRLVALGNETDLEMMRDYARIVRNFLLNTRSFVRKKCNFSPDLRYGRNGIPFMQNFVKVLANKENPYEIIANTVFKNINAEICLLEAEKARLIIERPKLKPVLHALEDMEVFRGIIFNLLPYVKENDDEYLVNNLRLLFTKDNGVHIIRALLSVGDYGISVGSSIYGERYFYGHINNLYSIMTYAGGEEYEKIICKFIEQFENTESKTVKDSLDEMIATNLLNISKQDWKYTILKYENALKPGIGYIDNPYIIFAMKSKDSKIVHRSNGFILNGYHVVPEYIEIRERLGNLCGDEILGFGSETDGCIPLTCTEGLYISFGNSGRITVSRREEDKQWVDDVIKEYRKINVSAKDKVECAVLLAKLLFEKCDEIYGRTL